MGYRREWEEQPSPVHRHASESITKDTKELTKRTKSDQVLPLWSS